MQQWLILTNIFMDYFYLSVEVYQVTVHTGDRWAAHTNATVWVNLHGDQGDSGKRILYHSSVEGTMFMKDKKDVFNVEAVSLGMLKMVEIGHDGIGYGKSVIISVITKISNRIFLKLSILIFNVC